MAKHPIFLIVRAKIAQSSAAIEHMNAVDAQQRNLLSNHPDLYSESVHAESLAMNVLGIYTQLEAILKTLANAIDGYSPSGEAWHRDLLLQVASSDENRSEVISQETMEGMVHLLRFRHAIRNNYASEIRAKEVFENVKRLQSVSSAFLSDIERFVESFAAQDAPPKPRGPS